MNIRAAILSLAFSAIALSAYAAPPMTITGSDGKQAPVKAPSTAAATTDPSLVVQFSPNGTVAGAILSTAPVATYPSTASPISGMTSAMTGTTSTLLVAAPGASTFNYITTLTCGNSHATVGTFVVLQDGSGGTGFWTVPAAAVYGGAVVTFSVPLKQPTANTALYVVDSTTGANVICSVAGYKG